VTSIRVKRAVKLYREKGTKGFYAPRVTRGAVVLSEHVVAQIEELLADGASEAEAAVEARHARQSHTRRQDPHAP
jgi:hypothetical protein